MLGASARLKRERIDRLDQARWAGFFAQAKPSEHDKVLKKLTSDPPKRGGMTGTQIALAMRAWVARSR